jgi:hypothetical protein
LVYRFTTRAKIRICLFGEIYMEKFKVNDRVRRLPHNVTMKIDPNDHSADDPSKAAVTTTSTRGCIGTVKTVREETTLSSRDTKEKTLMVHVLWDNGTLSFLGPDGLEVVQ